MIIIMLKTIIEKMPYGNAGTSTQKTVIVLKDQSTINVVVAYFNSATLHPFKVTNQVTDRT